MDWLMIAIFFDASFLDYVDPVENALRFRHPILVGLQARKAVTLYRDEPPQLDGHCITAQASNLQRVGR